MGKIASKKTEVDGYLFDSKTESEYYIHLKNDPSVTNIIIQPQYTLLDAFKIQCGKCVGRGNMPSPKTGKPIKCKTCEGTGKKSRQDWTYKADFKVTYQTGREEVIDVKGWVNDRFPLVKKMWERVNGQELVVVKKVKGEWKRG